MPSLRKAVVGCAVLCCCTALALAGGPTALKALPDKPLPTPSIQKQLAHVDASGTRLCDPNQATLTITIVTDQYYSETSWEVQVQASGVVVASGGGYTSQGTFTEEVCLDPAECYKFVMYDSFGDGIYSPGGFELNYEGTVIYSNIGSGWGGSSITINYIGTSCVVPTGACCVDGTCAATNTEAECQGLGGVWFAGEDCATFTDCPQPPACPDGSLYGQIPHDPNDAWSFGTSEADANGSVYLRAESFTNAVGDICDIHWWGLMLYNDGISWNNCSEPNAPFSVIFYADAGGAPGAPVATYNVVPTMTPTGILFAGVYEMLYFSVDSLSPCLPLADHGGAGWVSIQGAGSNTCWFLWASSSQGDGSSYFNNNGVPEAYLFDDAYCLTGNYIPQIGGCCIDSTSTCTDGVDLLDCLAQGGRFDANGCSAMDPTCGLITGACCRPDDTCDVIPESQCTEPDALWLGPNTTCDMCPCLVVCPPGQQDEGEPCGADTNGGCNGDPNDPNYPMLSEIKCDDVICGTAWFDGSTRDTDWYYINTTEQNIFTITVEAEFDVLFGLLEMTVPGQASCANSTGYISPYAAVGPCEETVLTTACLPAGTHWFFVAPQFTNNVTCGSGDRYTISLTCTPCVIPTGACCMPDGSCVDGQYEDVCTGLGGTWQGADTLCESTNCPQPPPNDDCVDAIPLTVIPGGTVNVIDDNSLANDDNAPTCDTSSPGHGMWYVITGTGNTITATTCSANTTFDTKIHVWADCNYGLCIGGNDDATCSFSGLHSTFTWCSEAGTDYYIMVGGFSSNVGTFDLQIIDDGVPCTAPTGRCCYNDPVECAVLTAADCADLGGDWNETLDCGTPCPSPFAETCDTAIDITSTPYAITFDNNNATADGPPGSCNSTSAVVMQNDAWFKYTATTDCGLEVFMDPDIGLGYDSLMAIYTGPDCNSLVEIDCYDDPEPYTISMSAIAGTTYWFQIGDWGTSEGGGETLFTLDCLSGTGACCFYGGTCEILAFGDCLAAGGEFQGDGSSCDPNPCPLPCVECPPGAADEGEPCGDDTNGGCNTDPNNPPLTMLTCGVPVCGTGWFDGSTRDTDWFEITVAEPTQFSWTVEAEFAALVGMLEMTVPGSASCANSTGYLAPYANIDACVETTVSTVCMPAGTYWFFVAPQFTDTVLCTDNLNHYVATLTCTPCEIDPYCAASGGCDEYIENVSILPIDNTSACENYANFTDLKTRMVPGNSYEIQVLVGNVYSSDLVNVWIDWNQDYDLLDETGYALARIDGTDIWAGPIDCPAGALLGDTRMRVRLEYSTSVGPCGTSTYGEVEDYTVNVGMYDLGDANCDGLVNNGDIDAFLLALDDYATYVSTYGCENADMNLDGTVDNEDIDPFVAALIGNY